MQEADERDARLTGRQALAIIKAAVHMLAVAPRTNSLAIYTRFVDVKNGRVDPVNWRRSLSFDGEIFFVKYDKGRFELSRESRTGNRTFDTEASVVKFFDDLIHKSYHGVDVVEISDGASTSGFALFRNPQHMPNAQTPNAARALSAARKISRAYLKAYHDPKHIIGQKRLAREYVRFAKERENLNVARALAQMQLAARR